MQPDYTSGLSADGFSFVDSTGRLVKFYWKPKHMAAQSEIEGRPRYEDRPRCRIVLPDDLKTVPDFEVKDGMPEQWRDDFRSDKRDWYEQWTRFKAAETGHSGGTPLANLGLQSAQMAELAHGGIKSCEQVAHMSDDHMFRLGPGGLQLREKARRLLEPASEVEQEIRRENLDLKNKLSNLESKIEQMVGNGTAQAVPDDEPAPVRRRVVAKRKPGRPKGWRAKPKAAAPEAAPVEVAA